MELRSSSKFNPSQKAILLMELVRKEILRGLFIFFLLFNVFFFLRIVLRLFGADPHNLFAGFVYMISGFFLLPFSGIFPQFRDEIIAGQMTFDISAMMAGFCSNILTLMTMCIVHVGVSMLKTNKQSDEATKRNRAVDTRPVDRALTQDGG